MKLRLVVAAAALLLVSLTAVAPASAQYVGGSPPKAGPVAKPTFQAQGLGSPVKVEVGGASQTARTTSRLAVTGADIAQMVLIGGAFLVGGSVLVRRSRRRVPARAL